MISGIDVIMYKPDDELKELAKKAIALCVDQAVAGNRDWVAVKLAVEKLTELGSLEKQEPYTNNVGYSERADVPIEPRLSEQWFLKYPSVDASKKCVAGGQMKFFPDRWAKVYDHWMGGIQDWCVSRQLWWGNRIPVWRTMLTLSEKTWSSVMHSGGQFYRILSGEFGDECSIIELDITYRVVSCHLDICDA